MLNRDPLVDNAGNSKIKGYIKIADSFRIARKINFYDFTRIFVYSKYTLSIDILF